MRFLIRVYFLRFQRTLIVLSSVRWNVARLLRQLGVRRIEYFLPCISFHETCCVDSDFLFGCKCILACVPSGLSSLVLSLQCLRFV